MTLIPTRSTFRPGDPITLEMIGGAGVAGTVEVWHLDRCNASFDRLALRDWLSAPEHPLAVADVAFTVDRMVDRSGRVALSLPDVLVWTLAPDALAGLRQRL